VASSSTGGSGGFSITFTPKSSGSYQVATGSLSQVENASLSPAYGDILSPAATTASALTVQGTNTLSTAQATSNAVSVVGSVGPSAPDASSTVAIMARKQGSKGAFKSVGTSKLPSGQSIYAFTGKLAAGKWQVETVYKDGTQFVSATSASKNVTVKQGTTNVSFKKTALKKGKITVNGALSLAPAINKAKVVLLALQTNKAHGTATFKQIGKTSVGTGKKKFTIKGKLARGNYVLELKYTHSGQPTTVSKLKSISVH
jgi:hypothetical protein